MNKIKFSRIIKLALLVAGTFLFYQCMQEEFELDKLDDDVEIEAGLLSPLAYGSLNLEDIISELDSSSFITSDADGLLMITYEDSLFSYIADDLLEVPATDFLQYYIESDFTILAGYPFWNTGDTLVLEETEDFPFSFENDERLDSMILDAGALNFSVSSEFQHTGNVIMSSNNIRRDNDIFIDTIVIDDPSGGFSGTSTFDLEGYTIHLSDSVGSDSMYLKMDFRVELINSGAGINADEEIEINASIDNMNFDAIFGYIGNYELITQTGDLDLGFFQNSMDGYIRFEDPRIYFNLTNSYGLPAAVSISRFTGFNGDGDSVQMNFNSSVDTFGYAYPTIEDYVTGDIYKDTTISINSDNSDVSDFLAFSPSTMVYSLSAQSNPDGESASSYNFVSDDSQIGVDFEFVLPMWFQADSFALVDTIELDLIDIDEDVDFIENVNIMLEVFNGMPLDIDFQVFFVDSAYNHVDSLFNSNSQPVIKSALINEATGDVISSSEKTSLVEYSNEEITALNKVRYGILRVGLKTPSDANDDLVSVKFYTDYSVDFSLSVGVDIKANSNDF